jgi:hypothetical protein
VNTKAARLLVAVTAPLALVGGIALTGGVASASKPATTPSISCKSLTTTITWTPALVPGTATSSTTQIKFIKPKVSGCTSTPKSAVTAATSVTATASLTTHGNSCSSLEHSSGAPTKYTFKVKWKGGGTSTVTFEGSSVVTKPKPGFALKEGTATGAYPSKSASAVAYPNAAGATAVARCIAGSGKPVSSVTVVGGTFSA